MNRFKEEIKNSLKEMEEKANKNQLEEINKYLKGNQEKIIKHGKQRVETLQDLKTEIKAIKKTPKRGILEMENPFKQMETTDAHIINQIEGMEGRISAVESAEK